MADKRTLIVRDFDDSLAARIACEARARRNAVNQFLRQTLEATLNPPRKSLSPLMLGKGLHRKPRAARTRPAEVEARVAP